ncbi:hypothetical protein OsI_25620 [Oryza sativa Indica Group]|uniref:Uncharacterized protein n=2 Tax=Oryza sativa TaxID=4530 RepID=B9FWL7_ORYSJ|nr:hypothetical protein OsI_25620 [Oryza sativa Indica Group]EEE66954.1 hypothetical protein OsJ_23825 [Oryza sativa Japonica Group]
MGPIHPRPTKLGNPVNHSRLPSLALCPGSSSSSTSQVPAKERQTSGSNHLWFVPNATPPPTAPPTAHDLHAAAAASASASPCRCAPRVTRCRPLTPVGVADLVR